MTTTCVAPTPTTGALPRKPSMRAELWWLSTGMPLDVRAFVDQDVRVTPGRFSDSGGGNGRSRAHLRAATPDDETLVRELYDEYSRSLLTFVMRLVAGDRQWAEDVVQETLLRAWRNAEKFQGAAAKTLRPWLCTVARRIVIDDHRARQARPQETDDEPLRHIGKPDHTEKVVHRVAVRAALQQVSPAHREILLETYFRDRTVQQAADVLGLPPGTVKSRVYYALRARREALEGQGVTS